MIKTIKTKGMHCPSCERIIEKAALSLKGVVNVKSNFANETTEVDFDDAKVSLAQVKEIIKTKGYECEELCETAQAPEVQSKETENATNIAHPAGKTDDYYTFPKINSKYLLIAGGLLFLLGIYWITKYSFSFQFPEITPGMGLALIFTVGLLTSFHCVGMCGGFVLSYTTKDAMDNNPRKGSKFLSHLQYGAGKTLTYVTLGALFGLLGSFIAFTPTFKGIAALVAGLFLVVYGLNMLNIFPWLRRLQWRGPKILGKINADATKKKGPFIIGLLNGLMVACGPLQAMLIYSAGTASMLQGALAMLVFGLGTLPLMMGFGSIATILGTRFTHKVLKFSAVIVIVMGIVMLNRGLTLTGSGYDFNTIVTTVKAQGSGATGAAVAPITFKDGYQEIKMDVTRYGWEPDKFVLKKGVPVKWIINGKEINGCNNAIQVPKLGLNFKIKPGLQTIEFTPTEEGVIPWSCWMGMIPGTFIVKEDTSNQAEIEKELANVKTQPAGSCGGGSGGGCGCGGA
jgi:sulfite exporter TauE/SafE/copper chaperone CopZ